MGSAIRKTKQVEPHPYLAYIYEQRPAKSPYGIPITSADDRYNRTQKFNRRSKSLTRFIEEGKQVQTEYKQGDRQILRNSETPNLSSLAFDIYREELIQNSQTVRTTSALSTRTSFSDPGRAAKLAADESGEYPWYMTHSANQCRVKAAACLSVAQPGRAPLVLAPADVGGTMRASIKGKQGQRPFSCPLATGRLKAKWSGALPPKPVLSRHMSRPNMETILKREASRVKDDDSSLPYILPEMKEEVSSGGDHTIPPPALY